MNEKREPLIEDSPKHKKKSQNKGVPRSKHKHLYKTVLLGSIHYSNSFGITTTFRPNKVCSICGRIGEPDMDPSYYAVTPAPQFPWISGRKELSEKANALPLWMADSAYKTAREVKDQ